MPKRYKVYQDFSGGLNTKTNPKLLKDNELSEASGVSVDERGSIRTISPAMIIGEAKAVESMPGSMVFPGRGIFAFKSDYSYSSSVNTIAARESEYLCIADENTSQIDLYGYDDNGNDHANTANIMDLGSSTELHAEYYYADGALRVTDANFSNDNSTTKWFGRIGDVTKKNLLGCELDREWVALDNKLEAPTVGFFTTSLSGTATGNATTLTHSADGSGTGLITAMASATDFTRFTSGSHNLAVGDVVTLIDCGRYNGTYTIVVVSDGNNFDIDERFGPDETGATSRWIKNSKADNFQGWNSGVSSANSGSRWLIAYDDTNNDTWKITGVTESTQSFTTTSNSSDWNDNAFAIFPFPGDGVLLEVYQSEGSEEGDWEEGEYEFAQSFLYEGNQESKVVKMLGNNLKIDNNQVIYARVHVSGIENDAENNTYINRRLIGGRVYIRKAGSNNFWSLLMDMDFRIAQGSGGKAEGSGGGDPLGTRISTVEEYDEWNEGFGGDGGGEAIGSMSATNFQGYRSDQYTIKRMSIESYENLNGFSASEYALTFGEAAGYGYKTSTIAGQRVFVANVKYVDPDSGIAKIMGDAIFYTPVGKYDTFPSSYKLNIAGNDGDEFTCLKYSNGILLAFKRNSLFLIDISNPNEAAWRLLAKHEGMGVDGDYSVAVTNIGIAWANRSGMFLFSKGQPVNLSAEKLSYSDWFSFTSSSSYGPAVGWDNSSNKLLIIDDCSEPSEARMFDLNTRIWTKGFPLATNPKWTIPGGSYNSISNMITFTGHELQTSGNASINASGGILLYGDDEGNNSSSTSTDLYSIGLGETKNSAFKITTKDDDFGIPNIFKKIYSVEIEYIVGNSTDSDTDEQIEVRYEIDGNDVPNDSSNVMDASVDLAGVAGKDNVNIYKLDSSNTSSVFPIKCRSISLRIESEGTTEFWCKIISIGIRYRPIQLSEVATETSSS